MAFTDRATPTHANVFKGANNLMYALSGLPPMPEEKIAHAAPARHKGSARAGASRHAAAKRKVVAGPRAAAKTTAARKRATTKK